MPQVQVLPANPNFGTQLAQVLGQGVTNLAQGYIQGKDNQRVKSLYDIINDPKASAIQKASAVSRLPKDMQAQKVFGDVLAPQSQAEQDAKALEDYMRGAGIQPKDANGFASQFAPGTMPEQEGDPRNIKSSVTPPPTTTASPGSMMPPQGSPQLLQAPPANVDAKALQDERDDLRKFLGLKGFKSPAAQALYAQKQARYDEINDLLKENRSQAQEARVENRKEINKFAEPYENIASLKQSVGKLNKAKKLIENDAVSFDENQFRNFLVAALEDRESNIGELLKTDAQQELFYLTRDSLKPKELGGTNPSTREFLYALATNPSIFKGKKANLAIVESLLSNAEENLERGKTVTDLKKDTKNLYMNPGEFKDKVEQSASKFRNSKAINGQKLPEGSVWMISPEGEVGSVRKDQIEEALQNGFTNFE